MKTIANQTANEVMDARIAKLNEKANVKMSSLSKGKREAVKAARESAKTVLENWDNLFELHKIASSNTINDREIFEIVTDRLNDFEKASKACEAAAKAYDSQISLTDGELLVLEDFINATQDEGFVMEDAVKAAEEIANIDSTTFARYASSLQNKGMLEMYNGSSYYDGKVTELGMKTYKEVLATIKDNALEKSMKKDKVVAHKVGDIHPNGKWIWTEYKEGKFDWRTIPSKKTGVKRQN